MKLSKLEEDFLGDLAQDPHELWELYAFVRHHRAAASATDVLQLGCDLLSTWVNRNWLKATKSRRDASPLTGEQLLAEVSKLGPTAVDPEKGIIVLDLTDRAALDVDWLRTSSQSAITTIKQYRSDPRQLKPFERLLIERLLESVESSTILKDQLSDVQVREMEDGGMGSLYFLHPQKSDNERGVAHQVAEIALKDADGIPVSVALNLDAEGALLELDIFKADFSPTIKIQLP